ncbi:hypothetical protein V6N13_037654 [Hibiscus sabdariffa]|uniref:Uncharacterized protein n=1 Tax=Hibiscus sabdariffa TaxID=183260 RepID=A0ABR2S4G0_9ROSI
MISWTVTLMHHRRWQPQSRNNENNHHKVYNFIRNFDGRHSMHKRIIRRDHVDLTSKTMEAAKTRSISPEYICGYVKRKPISSDSIIPHANLS